MAEPIDIAVIGAGPCGLGVGAAARLAGVGCVLFDKGSLTGTLIRYPAGMTFFSTPDRLEIGGVPFIVAGDKPTRSDALKYYRRVAERLELDVRQYEEVVEVSGERGRFVLQTRRSDSIDRTYTARNVVLATGYYDTPNLLNVPGEALPKVNHYYHEGHPYWNQDCLVIGGGNSAVDAALDLYRAGARVTLVHFADTLDRGVKPWVLPDIRNRLDKGEVDARWNTRVVEIHPDRVLLRSQASGKVEELENDWVFAMTGYAPDFRPLHALGVHVDPDTAVPAHNPETMETNVPGVFIAGVLAAGYDANKVFIENGREHGPRILAGVMASR